MQIAEPGLYITPITGTQTQTVVCVTALRLLPLPFLVIRFFQVEIEGTHCTVRCELCQLLIVQNHHKCGWLPLAQPICYSATKGM